MEAKDFRIGNLVKQQGSNFVECITLELLCRSDVVLKPTELTKKWLLNSGANLICDRFIYDRFQLTFLISYGYWYVTDLETNCYLTKIVYLHEWQNFIFVMNGEELEINLC
jgi:hypothetical protein